MPVFDREPGWRLGRCALFALLAHRLHALRCVPWLSRVEMKECPVKTKTKKPPVETAGVTQAVTRVVAVLQLCRDGRERSVAEIATALDLSPTAIPPLLALLQTAAVPFDVITDAQKQQRYRLSVAWLARTPLTKSGGLRKNNVKRPARVVTATWLDAVRAAMQQQDRTVLDVATASDSQYDSLRAVLSGRMAYSSCVGPVSEALGIPPTEVDTWVRDPHAHKRLGGKMQQLYPVTVAWRDAVYAAATSDGRTLRDIADAAQVVYSTMYRVLRGRVARASCVEAVSQVLRLEDVDGVWQRRKK